MKPGDRIRNIYELRDAIRENEKRSVIAPWYSADEPKPHPAAFALNMNAWCLERMFRSGLFIYGKDITEYVKKAEVPEPHWQSMYEREKKAREQAQYALNDERDKWEASLKILAKRLIQHIEFHHGDFTSYLTELAEIEAGLI